MKSKLLWALQLLLALAFAGAGTAKLMTPREEMIQSATMTWAEDFSDSSIKLIGTAEVLGAIGLIVPAATGIAPALTPAAAAGLAALMGGAVATHVRRGEPFVPPLMLGLLCVVVVVGRARSTPRRSPPG